MIKASTSYTELLEEDWLKDRQLANSLRDLNPQADWGGMQLPRDRVVIEKVLFNYPVVAPVILEVGALIGGCSNVMLTTRMDAKLMVIDNWSFPFSGRNLDTGKEFTLKEGFLYNTSQFKDRIKIVEGDSINVGRDWSVTLDILLVDGDHSYKYASADIRNFGDWVKQGGIIMVDDYNWLDVKEAVDDRLLAVPSYKLIRLPNINLKDCEEKSIVDCEEKLIVFQYISELNLQMDAE